MDGGALVNEVCVSVTTSAGNSDVNFTLARSSQG